jgi:phosphoribosyl-dephospho-CoA transferase
MFHCEAHSVRTHDLLKIAAKQLIYAQSPLPEWVEEHLLAAPFVVVRRGPVTEQRIAIGIRGTERNQRWAAFCHPKLVKSVLTPPQLLRRTVSTSRADATPALRALSLLKERWLDLDHPWGPGGSVGFELATGRHVVKPESDLDIVLYLERRMAADEAKSLCTRTMDLPAVVDIRVETPVCGFSLREFASQSPAAILMRGPCEVMLGSDPWGDELRSMHSEITSLANRGRDECSVLVSRTRIASSGHVAHAAGSSGHRADTR